MIWTQITTVYHRLYRLNSTQLQGRFYLKLHPNKNLKIQMPRPPYHDSNSAISVTKPTFVFNSGSGIIPRHNHNQEHIIKHWLLVHWGKFCLNSIEQLSWSSSPLHLGFHHPEGVGLVSMFKWKDSKTWLTVRGVNTHGKFWWREPGTGIKSNAVT